MYIDSLNPIKDNKLLSYTKLIENYPIILTLQVELTNSCICKCNMCSHWKWEPQEIDYDALYDTIERCRMSGLESIVFTGGEPTLYSKFFDLIKFCYRHGLKLGLITSGCSTLDLGEWYEIAKYFTWIRFSIDSFKSSTYEKIRGVKLKKAYDALKRVIKYNLNNPNLSYPEIRINYTIQDDNFPDIYHAIDKCKELGIPIAFFPERSLKYRSDTLLFEIEEALYKIKTKQIDSYDDYTDNIYIYDFPTDKKLDRIECIIPKINAYILANGDIYPCCILALNNDDYNNPIFHDRHQYRLGSIIKGGRVKEDWIDNIIDIYKEKIWDNTYLIDKKFGWCGGEITDINNSECLSCHKYYNINKAYHMNKKNKVFI